MCDYVNRTSSVEFYVRLRLSRPATKHKFATIKILANSCYLCHYEL